MFDFEARHVIEALRSGIPSRAVGQYFSEARPGIMKEISGHLDETCETGKSKGMIIAGKYGEGKTHLLNTVFSMAHSNNMVVSYLSLSKETPFDKLYLVYQKLVNNTFLPKRVQPGFTQILEKMTPGSPAANELLLYAAKHLETDKLYYLLRAYLNTEDLDEKFMLQADLEGDFIANVLLKQIYRRIYNERVKYNVNFSKTKHCRDYFSFLSRLFRLMGYNGWVILIDETELIGRLSKKARLNAYRNMAQFLLPDERLEGIYTLFALGASYTEDVIETKHDYENLEEIYPEQQEPVRTVLNLITRAQQLAPLTDSEIREVLEKIQVFHGRAYDWNPNISMGTILAATQSGGYLLRTKLRAAIELLDQLYQYGEAGNTRINELGQETFEEDVPSLEEFDSH
ncbi:MAG: BREX system ATP-binding domain-containing protein [Enterocloster clostridioformis]|nr:BREX system ATP-binding domain-containing protein [Enterocloster clostridioformis]